GSGQASRRAGGAKFGQERHPIRGGVPAVLSAGNGRFDMKPTIVRTISRPEATAISVLGELGVATLHEAQGRRGLMKPYLRPIFPAARVAGPAVTVLSHPGDNLMIHAAVELCRPGDVLVVALVSASTDGMFGELLACSLRAHGVVGM